MRKAMSLLAVSLGTLIVTAPTVAAPGNLLVLGRPNDAGANATTLTTDSPAAALRVFQQGSGRGIVASTSNGDAISAYSSTGDALVGKSPGGVAVVADGGGDGVALELRQGALRVTGAGTDTPTVAFVSRDRQVFSCGEWLDNPMVNDKPDVLIFLTARSDPGSTAETPYVEYLENDTGDCYGGHWYIRGVYTPGTDFNVLVITP